MARITREDQVLASLNQPNIAGIYGLEESGGVRALVMELVEGRTCKIFPGRPVIGSWITYALGSESQNLPAYVVLRDPEGYSVGARLLWSSGWLPALFQGVEFSSRGTRVHYIKPFNPLPPTVQRRNH